MNTPITDVNSLGVSGTRFVKINSNRVWLHFVSMYNASVTPLNFEFTVFDVTFRTQLYPIATKLIIAVIKDQFVALIKYRYPNAL